MKLTKHFWSQSKFILCAGGLAELCILHQWFWASLQVATTVCAFLELYNDMFYVNEIKPVTVIPKSSDRLTTLREVYSKYSLNGDFGHWLASEIDRQELLDSGNFVLLPRSHEEI